MDFVYVEDVARANILAAKASVTDEAFNVASGVEISLNELAQTLICIMQSEAQPVYGPERRINPVPRRLAAVSKAKQLLGFETRVSLADGLRRLVAWWQETRLPADKISKVPTVI
jgi:UDP-glucose 4-epimerase